MTHPEIYQQLKLLTPAEWKDIKAIISSYSQQPRSNYLALINKTNPTAKDFFINAIVEDDYSNTSVQRQKVGWSTMNNHSLFRTTHTRGGFRNLIANLPQEFYKYLPSNIATRLKKEARKTEITNNTKAIQLNEFSYQVFKAQLQNAKKKLAGNEAIAQIRALPNPTTQEEKEYFDKFLALFWNHLPKKSIEFCDKVINISKYTAYTPITIINRVNIESILNQDEFGSNEVHIPLYNYQHLARIYNIPVLEELYTDRHSEHHNWVSGVPKSTPLNQIQLEMTVSQILVLDFIITNLQKDSQCPYFTKLKSHLVSEVSKPEYKDALTKLTSQMQTSYTSALKATNELIQLHNQISTDRKS